MDISLYHDAQSASLIPYPAAHLANRIESGVLGSEMTSGLVFDYPSRVDISRGITAAMCILLTKRVIAGLTNTSFRFTEAA